METGSESLGHSPSPPTDLSVQKSPALYLGTQRLELVWAAGIFFPWKPRLLPGSSAPLPAQGRPPRATKLPFDLFKARAQCTALLGLMHFSLSLRPTTSITPFFILCIWGFARAGQCHLFCLISVRPFVKILAPEPPLTHPGPGEETSSEARQCQLCLGPSREEQAAGAWGSGLLRSLTDAGPASRRAPAPEGDGSTVRRLTAQLKPPRRALLGCCGQCGGVAEGPWNQTAGEHVLTLPLTSGGLGQVTSPACASVSSAVEGGA